MGSERACGHAPNRSGGAKCREAIYFRFLVERIWAEDGGARYRGPGVGSDVGIQQNEDDCRAHRDELLGRHDHYDHPARYGVWMFTALALRCSSQRVNDAGAYDGRYYDSRRRPDTAEYPH